MSVHTSVNLQNDEEPNVSYRMFWSFMLLVIPIGVLVLENQVENLNVLSTMQSIITITSVPILLVLFVVIASFVKEFKKDIDSLAILEFVDEKNVHIKGEI